MQTDQLFRDYKQACAFLENFSKLETPFEYMKLRENLEVYLERMQDLLNRLGNPEHDLQCIHITGTAGKGTSVAMVHAMLHNAGYVVGSTSSPATTTTLERIKVGDYYISAQDFIDIVERLKPIIIDMYMNGDYGKPSYFDIMFALALIYFKAQKCDWVVLEVGMGGRYDSTNVIANTKISAISNIHYDHTHLLGDSLTEIAYEKAGIIKSGSTFFTTENDPDVLKVFTDICREKNVVCHSVSDSAQPNQDLVTAIGNYLNIDREYYEKAFADVRLPCRFEQISEKPLVILDGAHNISKVAYSLEKLKNIQYKNLHVVFAAGKTKDALGMLDLIVNYAQTITLTMNIGSHTRSFSPKEMYDHLEKEHYYNCSIDLDAESALEKLIHKAQHNDLILVIGSLYLTGHLRKRWFSEESIIKNRKSF